MNEVAKIKKQFNLVCKNNKDFNSFYGYLSKAENNIFIGGFLRNCIENKSNYRDIDIITYLDSTQIKNYLEINNIEYKLNSFNGYKIKFENLETDVWSIKDHYAFKNNYYKENIKNILQTTVLNYDSIIYDINNEKLYCEEYKKCKRFKTLNIIGDEKYINNNPKPEFVVAKILKIKDSENYKLSEKTIEYIKINRKKSIDFSKNVKLFYEYHYKEKLGNNLIIDLDKI